MILKPRTVTVKQLPPAVDRRFERTLLHQLAIPMHVERPALVLDCSPLRQMDSAAVHLLLCCLEEAMKRNGDVRLAGLSAEASQALAAWGVDGLFRTFDSTEKATESFQRRTAFVRSHAQPDSAAEPSTAQASAALASEHAA